MVLAIVYLMLLLLWLLLFLLIRLSVGHIVLSAWMRSRRLLALQRCRKAVQLLQMRKSFPSCFYPPGVQTKQGHLVYLHGVNICMEHTPSSRLILFASQLLPEDPSLSLSLSPSFPFPFTFPFELYFSPGSFSSPR